MSYKSSARPADAADAERDGPSPMPCLVCRQSAEWKTLSEHGGMCLGCYGNWRSRPVAESPNIGDKAKDGDMAWAPALRKRELMGERLTPFQRGAWREAIGAGATDE